MGRKGRLSKDQKRKAKLKERTARLRETEASASAYYGRKYQREELVPVYMEVEWAIYNADLMTKRRMLDVDAESALELLIDDLRRRPLPERFDFDELQGSVEGLIIANIIDRCQELFLEQPRASRRDLIGILRTTLASIETRGEMYHSPRGYLDWLPRYLKHGEAR
jgi:hypothetical protein